MSRPYAWHLFRKHTIAMEKHGVSLTDDEARCALASKSNGLINCCTLLALLIPPQWCQAKLVLASLVKRHDGRLDDLYCGHELVLSECQGRGKADDVTMGGLGLEYRQHPLAHGPEVWLRCL